MGPGPDVFCFAEVRSHRDDFLVRPDNGGEILSSPRLRPRDGTIFGVRYWERSLSTKDRFWLSLSSRHEATIDRPGSASRQISMAGRRRALIGLSHRQFTEKRLSRTSLCGCRLPADRNTNIIFPPQAVGCAKTGSRKSRSQSQPAP